MNMLLLTKWLTELPGKQQYEAKLIPLLLAGLADEIPSVNQLAEKGMAAVGNACGRVCDAEDAAEEGRMTELARSSKLVTARPVDGARALVRHHLSEMTAEVVQELKEWTLSARSLAAVKLTSLVVYSEASFASQMKSVLPALYQGCQDDEQEMAERMIRCTTVIGQYIAVDHYAPLLLSQVSGYRPDERGSCLRVLRYLLQSAIPTQLRPHLPSTLSMMTDPELLAAENPSVHIELMKLVHTVISTAGESCADVEADLFCVLIHLQSVQGDAALSAHAVQCIRDLAASVAASEVPALYERHLPGMLRKAVETHKQWTAASPERFLFDTLVRNAGVALGSQIDLVLTVMVQSTQPDRPAEIRLGLLALLLDMLSEPAVSAMLRPHAGRILGKVLLPNCQWQAGRVACAVRKAGVACCRALFVKDLCSFAHCVENMAELLPIWLTLLDDDSADVRLMMTECSESICRLFPNRLSDEHALKLYPELIKRLDDSNDGIRCAMCTTLCAFFDAVDEDYSRSTLEYIAKTLLIHLDDVNEAVQRAVLKPLQQLARLVPRAEFTALVQEAKQRHRETQYCDELLAMAT
jgi:dynein assembly factor 5